MIPLFAREKRFVAHGRAGAPLSKPANGERPNEYFGGFGPTFGSGFVEYQSYGISLSVKLGLTKLRYAQQIDVLYSKVEFIRYHTVGNVFSFACYAVSDMRAKLRRSAEDLKRTC